MKFSKSNRRSIYNRYFLNAQIDGNMARMVSRNTLDSWIIELKDDYCILYHDHPGQEQYHEHRRFRTVGEALTEIKSHDQYTISQKQATKAHAKRPHR